MTVALSDQALCMNAENSSSEKSYASILTYSVVSAFMPEIVRTFPSEATVAYSTSSPGSANCTVLSPGKSAKCAARSMTQTSTRLPNRSSR